MAEMAEMPCGMIILTQRRREHRVLTENNYCANHHRIKFDYCLPPPRSTELIQV